MKKKMSISIEENTVTQIETKVARGIFRNKSHLVEFAVNELLKKEDYHGF